MRDWPKITAELDRLATPVHGSADYAGQGALTPVLLGELHGADVRLAQDRREVLELNQRVQHWRLEAPTG